MPIPSISALARPAALLLAAAAAAQTQFPMTITSSCAGGRTSFQQDILQTAPRTGVVPLADFGATGQGACDSDVMFTHVAFWRLATDAACSQFYDSGLANDQGTITHTSTFASWLVHWPNVANRNVLDASWSAVASCCGATCGRVRHEWSLRNISGAPITIEFFAYTDFDYSVNFLNRTNAASTGDRQIVQLDASSPLPCAGIAEFYGESTSSWEVGPWPAIENNLSAAAFAPLSAAVLPFGPGDYTGALGWQRTLQPNEVVVLAYEHGHNCQHCATAQAGVAHVGTGHGTTTLTTTDLPRPGCPLTLNVTGPANVPVTLLIGGPTNLQLPGCPQALYVDPVIVALNQTLNGFGLRDYAIPAAGAPAFCGLQVAFQVFALVNGEPCLPLQNSDQLLLTYGM